MNRNGRELSATWVTCDYSHGVTIGSPIYEMGAPASKCNTGQNNKYPGLCSTNEN